MITRSCKDQLLRRGRLILSICILYIIKDFDLDFSLQDCKNPDFNVSWKKKNIFCRFGFVCDGFWYSLHSGGL
jgi:hypothetical protein